MHYSVRDLQGAERLAKFKVTHQSHINTIGVGPDMVETFQQSELQGIWNVVETNELLDLGHLIVVASLGRVQSIDNGIYVTKNTRVH